MRWRMVLKLGCPAACAACLAAGFASAGRWTAVPLAFIALTAWLSAGKWRIGFLPSGALAISVGVAVAGLFLSAPPAWMMLGAVCALAAWDVILFQRDSGISPSDPACLLETRHYRSLASALAIGLATAAAGPLMSIRISFWWMVALASLALAGLEGLRRRLAD
jgi:hypothetical protein